MVWLFTKFLSCDACAVVEGLYLDVHAASNIAANKIDKATIFFMINLLIKNGIIKRVCQNAKSRNFDTPSSCHH